MANAVRLTSNSPQATLSHHCYCCSVNATHCCCTSDRCEQYYSSRDPLPLGGWSSHSTAYFGRRAVLRGRGFGPLNDPL
eukprot:2008646-Lingulodinium_polyedra.AAC.2